VFQLDRAGVGLFVAVIILTGSIYPRVGPDHGRTIAARWASKVQLSITACRPEPWTRPSTFEAPVAQTWAFWGDNDLGRRVRTSRSELSANSLGRRYTCLGFRPGRPWPPDASIQVRATAFLLGLVFRGLLCFKPLAFWSIQLE